MGFGQNAGADHLRAGGAAHPVLPGGICEYILPGGFAREDWRLRPRAPGAGDGTPARISCQELPVTSPAHVTAPDLGPGWHPHVAAVTCPPRPSIGTGHAAARATAHTMYFC